MPRRIEYLQKDRIGGLIKAVQIESLKKKDVLMRREPEQGYVTFPLEVDGQPMTFPRLRDIQNWTRLFGSDVPVGMTRNCGNCPLSHALTYLLGGRWIVNEQRIMRQEKKGAIIATYIPPRLYATFVQSVDALSSGNRSDEQQRCPSAAVTAAQVRSLIDNVLADTSTV